MMDAQRCPGCGSELPALDGPTHAYMTSSPACWHAFGLVLEREYSSPELMKVHRLTVDAWAAQHPGDGSRRAIQSVGLHLARLMIQLEEGLSGDEANAAMLRFANRKSTLPELAPPAAFSITVDRIVDATGPSEHRQAVRRWAEATWADWAHQHQFIRDWAAGTQEPAGRLAH
ncbi:MAG TPA: DUF5946 family protein [Sphingomicrobium sp.]|nr:DUF5946 family protein [Sphingomicrobium sp.]